MASEPDWPELRPLGAAPADPAPVGTSDPDAAVFAAVLAATADPAPEPPAPEVPPPAETPATVPPFDPELRALVTDLVREEVRRELVSLREQVRHELMAELGRP